MFNSPPLIISEYASDGTKVPRRTSRLAGYTCTVFKYEQRAPPTFRQRRPDDNYRNPFLGEFVFSITKVISQSLCSHCSDTDGTSRDLLTSETFFRRHCVGYFNTDTSKRRGREIDWKSSVARSVATF